MTTPRFLLFSALGALLAIIAMLPGLGGAFLLDDKPTITENALVQVTSLDAQSLSNAAYGFAAGGGTRPLPMLTFALDYWRAGLEPRAFKLTNVGIHLLTTFALAWLFRSLLRQAAWPPPRADLTSIWLALAWGLHPLQVSSVLYIVQRMQTMATLFLVLGLIAYVAMRRAQWAGQSGRLPGIASVLCWMLAMASKEDAILFPLYTLGLELTLFRFRAALPSAERVWRRSYAASAVLATLLFVFWFAPRQWSWEAYPGRDFSTPERLLTQARVLLMYIGQVLWPVPSHLPFYYDNFQPSRGPLTPWTTLPSLVLVIGLLVILYRLRHTRPLLALGIFWFLGGHAIASNVLGLELVFEHRNHFPLIGAVLAIGDILAAATDRVRARSSQMAFAGVAILCLLSAGTLVRAQGWGSPIGFADYGIKLAPKSERAWINLCQTHFELSKYLPTSPHFRKALAACSKGAVVADGATNLTNLVLLKTIDGSVREQDWQALRERMHHVTLTPSNIGVAWHLVRYSNADRRINPRNVLAIIDIVGGRQQFRPEEYVAFGYYAHKNRLPEDAFRYFVQALRTSPPGSGMRGALIADLRRENLTEFADRLETMQQDSPSRTPSSH